MKLKDFLRKNDVTYRDFAPIIGTSLFTLHGIISGKRLPTLRLAHEIEKKTLGSVTFHDWLSSEDKNQDEPKKAKKKKSC